MDTQLLARLPIEQARCRELARQFGAMGSIGCFAAALIDEALRRADRAIIDGSEPAVRQALIELEAFGSAHASASPRLPQPVPGLGGNVDRRSPRQPISVPPVGRRPPRPVPLSQAA